MKIAILDDYLGVALELADWKQLSGDVELKVFREFFSRTCPVPVVSA